MRLADGQYRWMLARGMAVRDGSGRPVRMAGSLTDITAGKVADALTGLPNRVLFMDRLERLVEYARRCPEFHFAVLFLDLDRFKNVNDSLGHQAGDELLIQAARRLEECLRASDTIARVEKSASVAGHTVARMGGDEFAILLGGLEHQSDAVIVANRIRSVLEGAFELFGQDVRTSASIGIALGEAGYDCAADVLRDADTALYAAKAGGRGQCTVFDHAMRTQAVERLQLETDLRRALEQHEFRVHYQPIVSPPSGLVTGVEALVRWHHPQRGLLTAADFITVAEETGLVVPLGAFVFEEVCRQLQHWRNSAPNIPAFTVAVNLSARQLSVPDLPELLADIARRYDVPTSLLEIELTEQAILTSIEGAEALVGRLRSLGFRVSLDDFGTGYSSLAYLQRLPVDRLKLDRSSLHQWSAQSESTDGIIRTVVALARHLNSDVVAEGVETLEQLDRLREMQCDCAQGFYFSKAVKPDPLNRLLLAKAIEDGSATSAGAATTLGADPATGQPAGDIPGALPASRRHDDSAA
jgi:diguanylate cyclase (GGDEF)-like protein